MIRIEEEEQTDASTLDSLFIYFAHRSRYDQTFLHEFSKQEPRLILAKNQYFQTIHVQPQSTQVPAGSTVVLECTVFHQYGDVAWQVLIQTTDHL